MHPTRIGIFIQARSNSERLPGKVYAGLPVPGDCSVLEHIYRRMLTVTWAQEVVVLIPASDRLLADFCRSRQMLTYGGPEDDVRERYRRAAKYFNVDLVVRATGDNPCTDPRLALDTIREMITSDADLLSYSNLPLGVAVEMFRTDALMSDAVAPESAHREHVSLHIKHNPELYKVVHLEHPLTRGRHALPRLTVDTLEDLRVARNVYRMLGNDFTTEEVLKLFDERPELFEENRDVQQRAFVPELAVS